MSRYKKLKEGKKSKSLLTAMVLGALATTPTFAFADSETVDVPSKIVYHNGNEFAELVFFPKDVGIGTDDKTDGWYIDPSTYTLSEKLMQATASSTSYWSNILGDKAQNKTPWRILVNTDNKQNAGASSTSLRSDGAKAEILNAENFVKEQLQSGKEVLELRQDILVNNVPPAGDYGYSEVTIGTNMGATRTIGDGVAESGWWVDTDAAVPTNEQATDFVGTFRHELGHALGIFTKKQKGTGAYSNFFVIPDESNSNTWTKHLVDQNGNKAEAGKYVVSSEAGLILLNAARASEGLPALTEKDVFVLDEELTTDGKGFAYFVGDNVSEVLDGATFFGRNGLPVNGWENDVPELSHIQTAGMMSHRPYSNYTTFLEAELAVMQDIGYTLDRKAYYGKSIYNNGQTITNTQGYFARNDDGTAYLEDTYSTVPLGVGLHIYGSNNNVTQAANIFTQGTGATGVRIDGEQNTLNISESTSIRADGYRGNGVIVAYGNGQTVNQAGEVTADGEGGVGMRFDFGSSSNGASDEYRGSYIRYLRKVGTRGQIYGAENLNITSMGANEYNANKYELFGALVDSYNLSGKLSGGDKAIYIGKNAFVKNINVNNGASIKGDIASDWKHFGEAASEGAYDGDSEDPTAIPALKIQYNGKSGENGYSYKTYIPDLVTNLNFNADMSYDGNITGADNIKLNVAGNALTYNGSANVVGVSVAKDAELYGGEYELNDMSASASSDFTLDDTDKGNFINHGTIGAASKDSAMTINGNLISDGNIMAQGGGEAGNIKLSGNANVEGSAVIATNMLPNEKMTVIATTGEVTGDVKTGKSAMLDYAPSKTSEGLTVTAVAANNLENSNSAANNAVTAMNAMQQQLSSAGDSRVEDMRPLYSLNQSDALKTLSTVGSNAAAKSAGLAQKNSLTSHIITSRLLEAENLKPSDNNLWFKVGKNWGDFSGDAKYHGTTFALGYDKAIKKGSRLGAFISYGRTGFSDTGASNKMQDTRLGVYLGNKKGAGESIVYLDYGWLRNNLRRSLANLNLNTDVHYSGQILELGGEYKYNVNAGKQSAWGISPYVNAQISRLWQNGYTENSAGIYGHRVNSAANNYVAGGLGVEFKRNIKKGGCALRLGIKHAFTGANPKLRFSYVGDSANSYEMRGDQDKTHFIASIGGNAEFAPGWQIMGDARLQKGSHDRDVMCALTFKRLW